MTLLSVVVPTLGRNKRLKRALQSIEDQTRVPDSVAVVDGSSDRSAEPIVSTLEVPFETIYVHQSTDGLSNARNKGIEATESELVAFLDDDDQWLRKKLAMQIEAYNRTNRGLIYCGVKNVRPDGTVTNIIRPSSVPGAKSILTRNSIGSPSSVMVRRSDLERVDGFDESLPTREDWDFYIRLLQVTKAAAVPDPLLIKEYNPEGMSRNVEYSERDLIRVFKKHRKKYNDELERRFKKNYHFILGRRYAKTGEMSRARLHLRKSFDHSLNAQPVFYFLATFLGARGYTALRKNFQRLRTVV